MGCSPWGHKESDMTEQLSMHTHTQGFSFENPFSNELQVLARTAMREGFPGGAGDKEPA